MLSLTITLARVESLANVLSFNSLVKFKMSEEENFSKSLSSSFSITKGSSSGILDSIVGKLESNLQEAMISLAKSSTLFSIWSKAYS